ncbi:MAG: hypothetical protein V3V00_08380 [Saprospiraceae bacterium]
MAKKSNSAFKIGLARSADLYVAANANLKLDSLKKTKTLIEQFVTKGYTNVSELTSNNDFKSLFNKDEWSRIIKRTEKNNSKAIIEFDKLKKQLPNHFTQTNSKSGAIDLRDKISTPKFQGQRNTCSAYAATGLMEYLVQQKTENLKLTHLPYIIMYLLYGVSYIPMS